MSKGERIYKIAIYAIFSQVAGTLNHKLPVLLALNMNNKHNPDNTFLYSFDYAGEFNRYRDMDEETNMQSPFRAGVSLTDEALYLFPYPEHVKRLSPPDVAMAHRMVDLWTNFVITGNPLGSYKAGYWPPMTTLYGPYMKIDETLTIGGNYFNEFSATLRDEEQGFSLIREIYYLRQRGRQHIRHGQAKTQAEGQAQRRKQAAAVASKLKKLELRKSLVKRPNRNKIRL